MPTRTDAPESIDALRERLRALGYLDAPVDRFVLGAAARGGARFVITAGLRVGVIAGVALGLSALIALLARAPGLFVTRQDAALVGAALTVLFTLAAALAVGLIVLAANWYARHSPDLTARRARVIAAGAGIAVALGCAAYLTLWWQTASDVLLPLTWAWNVAAGLVAAIISLLLAHAVSVLILAALARTHADARIAAGGVLSSTRFLLAFGAVLLVGSIASFAVGPASPAPGPAARIDVRPTGYALRVIAIDGFDTEVSERLRAGGGLPTIGHLHDGARMPLHPGDEEPDPARDWTTLATGQPPARHGISALAGRRPVGLEGRLPDARSALVRGLLSAADLLRLTAPALASGNERRDPAFWEVAAAAGLRVAVVNWWATWPAPEGDNRILTDRALLRLDRGGALDAEIAPAAEYERLRARWAGMRETAAHDAAAAFAHVADETIRGVLTRSAEIDLLVAALAAPGEGPALDLLVVYLPGLDIAQHNLLQASGATSLSAMRDRVAGIESYYRFIDGLVGMLLPESSSHVDAALLWPGRVPDRDGALLLSGPPIAPGARPGQSHQSAAATLLYLLGLPVADDLAGDADAAVVSEAFRAAHPLRHVADYGGVRVARGARTGEPLDAEALERLRSLGYIR